MLFAICCAVYFAIYYAVINFYDAMIYLLWEQKGCPRLITRNRLTGGVYGHLRFAIVFERDPTDTRWKKVAPDYTMVLPYNIYRRIWGNFVHVVFCQRMTIARYCRQLPDT